MYRQFQTARTKKWVQWGFRDLVASRNEEAQLAGFPNYYEYRFHRNQLDYKNYRTMVADIKTKLAPKLRVLIQQWGKAQGISVVEGWDLPYLRELNASGEVNKLLDSLGENAPMVIAKLFYHSLGIYVDGYNFTMDLYPRDGKNTHAFALNISLPHVDMDMKPEGPRPDIRFLANLRQPVTWDDISTVIHELGHAVHMAEVRQPLAIFRHVGSVETEAIAMTLERLTKEPDFMFQVTATSRRRPTCRSAARSRATKGRLGKRRR